MFQLLCESHNKEYKQFQMLPIFESWLNRLFKNDWEIAMNKNLKKILLNDTNIR